MRVSRDKWDRGGRNSVVFHFFIISRRDDISRIIHTRYISVHSYANGGQAGRQIRSNYNFHGSSSVHPRHAWLFNSFGCFRCSQRARFEGAVVDRVSTHSTHIRSKVNVACTEYLVVIYSPRWNIRIEGGRFFFDRIFTTRVDDDQAVVDIRIRRESFNAIRRFIALSASSATWRGLGSLSRPSHPIFDARKTGVAVSDWSVSRFIPRDERRLVAARDFAAPAAGSFSAPFSKRC